MRSMSKCRVELLLLARTATAQLIVATVLASRQLAATLTDASDKGVKKSKNNPVTNIVPVTPH